MLRIDAITQVLKSVPHTSEWVESATLAAIDALAHCDENKVSAKLVNHLIKSANSESVDGWLEKNNIRTSTNQVGVPANKVIN